MSHMCFKHASDFYSLWRRENIDFTVCISSLSSLFRNNSENMPLVVFVYSMNTQQQAYVWVCLPICLCTVELCVCVVGRADKQAVGWEVEGVHCLRLLTQSWQNGVSGAPRNLAGGTLSCNLIPLHPTSSTENTQKQAARDTALSILIPLLVPFSSFCVTIGLREFIYLFFLSNLPSCQSSCLLLSGTHSLTHSPLSQDDVLRDVKAMCRSSVLRSGAWGLVHILNTLFTDLFVRW